MRIFTLFSATALSLLLLACSPEFNWRDYSSDAAPYRVMFPDKPSSHTRSVDLDGMKVEMTMTAVQVNGTMFAVGTAVAPDAASAEKALTAMKTALVNNIGATIKSEAVGKISSAAGSGGARSAAIDIDATGVQKGEPMRLVGHFESHDKRFYQVVVMGKAKDLGRENVETFMTSFKLQ
jgi:hypothetical protein